jgi:hypothetical protein
MHSIVQELSYRLDDPSDGTINVSLVINLVDPTFCLPVRLYIIRVVRLAVEEPIATLGDPIGTKSLVCSAIGYNAMAGGSLRIIRDDELYFSAIDIPCLIQVGFEVAL